MSLEGTLSPADAAGRTWDVLVVGAGPAGALSAFELSKRGACVLLVEKSAMPRPKVCGCCLNARACAVLERTGLGGLLRQEQAVPLHDLLLGAGKVSARVPLPGGVALSRRVLDSSLVSAAVRVGAHFLPRTRAALIEEEGGEEAGQMRRVRLHAEAEVDVSARVVLAADGLGGGLLARARIGQAPPEPHARIGAGVEVECGAHFYEPGTIYMVTGRVGYLGLVRLEDGLLDLACALDPEAVREAGGPGPVAQNLLASAGWPTPPGLASAGWRGTPALSRQSTQLSAHRLLVLGDAAGYVEPFTGEGMAWALASAEAVVPLALEAVRGWRPELCTEWARCYQRVVRRRQGICRVARAVLRRPTLTRAAVLLLSWLPALARPVVRSLEAPCEPLR